MFTVRISNLPTLCYPCLYPPSNFTHHPVLNSQPSIIKLGTGFNLHSKEMSSWQSTVIKPSSSLPSFSRLSKIRFIPRDIYRKQRRRRWTESRGEFFRFRFLFYLLVEEQTSRCDEIKPKRNRFRLHESAGQREPH